MPPRAHTQLCGRDGQNARAGSDIEKALFFPLPGGTPPSVPGKTEWWDVGRSQRKGLDRERYRAALF